METIIKSINRKVITQAYQVGLYYSEYDLEGHFICQQMIAIKGNHTAEEAEKEFHAKLRKKFNIKNKTMTVKEAIGLLIPQSHLILKGAYSGKIYYNSNNNTLKTRQNTKNMNVLITQ